MFKVKTEVCGNVDFGQNPNKPPYGVKVITLKSKSFDELKTKVQEWQYENDIGGGNWMFPPIYENDQIIGYMSYNCRIWADRNLSKEIVFN